MREEDVEAAAFALLDPLFPFPKGVRLIGVTISSFDDRSTEAHIGNQLPLL